jgi:hypothetical protein
MGFEPRIPEFERRKTVRAMDRAASVVGPSNFIAREIKTVGMMMKMKFTVDKYTQILNRICSQHKRISKFVLIAYNVRFLAKEVTLLLRMLGFIRLAQHHSYAQSVWGCKSEQSLGESISR